MRGAQDLEPEGDDVQVETAADGVLAGLAERPCRECSELPNVHTFPHGVWKIMAFCDANWEGSRGQYHWFRYDYGTSETV